MKDVKIPTAHATPGTHGHPEECLSACTHNACHPRSPGYNGEEVDLHTCFTTAWCEDEPALQQPVSGLTQSSSGPAEEEDILYLPGPSSEYSEDEEDGAPYSFPLTLSPMNEEDKLCLFIDSGADSAAPSTSMLRKRSSWPRYCWYSQNESGRWL